jgi:hypothetical protein
MVHKRRFDKVDAIIAFEEGQLNDKQVVELFQHLVDSGEVWGMQGFYGRTAMDLIEQGLVKPPEKETRDYYGNIIHFPKVKQRKV